MSRPDGPTRPSEVDAHVSWFDRFSSTVAAVVGRAWFFVACVTLILVWAPTFVFLDTDTYQLIINTATTIITYLLVALLQNTTSRADKAVQHKLNAIAEALAELMKAGRPADDTLHRAVAELGAAVGLEHRESS